MEVMKPDSIGAEAALPKPRKKAADKAPAPSLTFPQQLLHLAITRGNAQPDELDRLIKMVQDADTLEARKAHTVAMTALAADLEGVDLEKNKTNDDFGNKYISIGKLVRTVGPLLAKHGLAASWEPDQSKGADITVTCVLTHIAGHSTRSSLTVPRDIDGRKNELQAIKSSMTYARSITYETVCGLAATDANLDDDGKASGQPGPQVELTPLLKNARLSADQGAEAWREFWQACSMTQRRELGDQLPDLERRAGILGAMPGPARGAGY